MNRINIFLEHIYEACAQRGIPLDQMLCEAHEMGYSGLECDLWRLSAGAETKALFERCGMKAASIYSWYDFPHDAESQSLEKMKAHLETAELFGADKIMAIPGFFQPGDDRDCVFDRCAEQLQKLTELAAERGITVTVEDFDDLNSPCCNIAGLSRLFEGAPGLRFTFDTGNFAYVRESAAEACKLLRGRISHVHLKDRSRDSSRADRDGKNAKADISGEIMYPCETGGGYIGIEPLVKELARSGYSGDFSVEHFGAVDQTEYMRRSAENVKRWLSEV